MEGGGLRLRQALHVPEDGADGLVQGRERQLRLGFHPRATEHEHVARPVACVLQER